MKRMTVRAKPFPAALIPRLLKEHGISVNAYAEAFFSHPRFSVGLSGDIPVIIASLREIGLENGAALHDIFQQIPKYGLRPCSPCMGLLLRFAWKDQPQSQNAILSGTHRSPDQAVMVLSEILEQDDAFPKGLYLRNVDGRLWLRGYVCDSAYRFPGDALFAFHPTDF